MTQATPVRNPHEADALVAFWHFYEAHAAELGEELRVACLELPAFAEIIRAMTPEQIRANDERSLRLQRAAIVDGAWGPYLADLGEQGAGYAKMGVSFGAWFEILAIFRDAMRKRLESLGETSLQRLALVNEGLNRHLDIAMATIGDAYLSPKETIIRDQQEAIREISTPVLQIRDQVLVMPIVGLVDTHRARQLTESVLKAIRARRARAVVMDVTGVPIVDSKVAKHLAQTCESARLMGATVIVTGISQEIAQTLVTIGADLSSVRTLGDLQSGVEEVERILRGPMAPTQAASS
jgi:rsbT co-antagonist protein RsbR